MNEEASQDVSGFGPQGGGGRLSFLRKNSASESSCPSQAGSSATPRGPLIPDRLISRPRLEFEVAPPTSAPDRGTIPRATVRKQRGGQGWAMKWEFTCLWSRSVANNWGKRGDIMCRDPFETQPVEPARRIPTPEPTSCVDCMPSMTRGATMGNAPRSRSLPRSPR